MPKKKKRKKIKKKKSSRKKKLKKNKVKKIQDSELIYKAKSDWIKKAIINKSGYEKKYSDSIKNNDNFWKKEGKELLGSSHIQKLKIISTAKLMLILNGFMMEL